MKRLGCRLAILTNTGASPIFWNAKAFPAMFGELLNRQIAACIADVRNGLSAYGICQAPIAKGCAEPVSRVTA